MLWRGGAHEELSRNRAFKGTIFLGTYWYTKKCIILRAKMDELRESQPRFHDVLAFVSLCGILGPWKPKTLEALVLRTKVRDPGSRKSQNNPSTHQTSKNGPRRPSWADFSLGNSSPTCFFLCFLSAGVVWVIAAWDHSWTPQKTLPKRTISLKSNPWL